MTSFFIVVILAAAIVGLGAVIVLSQRQFETSDDGRSSPSAVGANRIATPRTTGSDPDTRAGAPPVPPPEFASSPLSVTIASTIESATRRPVRNSAEEAAISALRVGLTKAVEGEFAADLRVRIEAVEGVESLHDVRRSDGGTDDDGDGVDPIDELLPAPHIDHLVIGASGVFVVDSKVRAGKVSYDDESVFIGRGDDRCRDSMVDDIEREMAAVAAVVDPVPVHGVIVLADVLALPEEIRSEPVIVRGVRLTTPEQLAEVLTERGPVRDRAVVTARLRNAFEVVLPPPVADLRVADHPGSDGMLTGLWSGGQS